MAVINAISGFAEDMATWRRWLHAHPELGFDLPITAGYVADRLREFGVDAIETGVAGHGIVAVINGSAPGEATTGLRADMDALPIEEDTGLAHASTHPGKMHACGHDGHTAMLLGAARYLCDTRRFSGKVVLIFQPAEEDGGGAGVMVDEGVMDRYGIDQVYAIHNAPNIPLGHFQTTPGPIMAAVDRFDITVTGRGGHAAMPHETVDPIVAAVSLVQGINTIVSRNHYAMDELVVSVTQIHTGSADNVVPESAYICGTVRSFDKDVQAMVIDRLGALCAGTGMAFNVIADLTYSKGYPATVNDPDHTAKAAAVAADVVGSDRVRADAGREMGAEDFAYFLEKRPGAYAFLGAGPGAGLHHPKYEFNDEIAPIGASYFARLVESLQPIG